jgi:drug/metabolite transporter (DMT)-like permease
MPLTDNALGALFMSVSMASFTLNDTAMKAVMADMPLFQAIALRGVLATAGLMVLARAMGGLQMVAIPPADRLRIALRTLAEVAATGLFLAALVHMPLANLAAIMQALPLAVTLAAALFLGERVGWRRGLAIAVGFAGVLLIIRPGPSGFDVWSLMGLASVACVVLRDLATRGLGRATPSATVAVAASAAVTVAGLAGSTLQGWVWPTGGQLVGLGLASATLISGYMFAVMVMRVGDIGFVAPFRYTALLWALLLGWLVFGTLPDALTLLGAGLVVATGVFTLWRERRVRA